MYPRATQGAPFKPSASIHNATMCAVEAIDAMQKTGGKKIGLNLLSTSTIAIKNISSQDIKAHTAVKITGISFTPKDNTDGFLTTPCLTVNPIDADHNDNIAITIQPVRAGNIGEAAIDGICAVHLVTRHTTHKYADIILHEGSYQVVSSQFGPLRIVWNDNRIIPNTNLSLLAFSGNVHGTTLVQLEKTGGLPGSTSSSCTFSYTIKDLTGNILATKASPIKKRANIGSYTAATMGMAYYGYDLNSNKAGWILVEAFEVEQLEVCS